MKTGSDHELVSQKGQNRDFCLGGGLGLYDQWVRDKREDVERGMGRGWVEREREETASLRTGLDQRYGCTGLDQTSHVTVCLGLDAPTVQNPASL